MYWADGTTYKGDWTKGKFNGYGLMIFTDGRIKEGLFIDNMFKGHT